MKYPWREASTVILTALKKSPLNVKENYKVLVVKRSSKSSFMPNSYVFPGGATDPADFNEAWLNIFSNFNVDLVTEMKLTGEIPPMLKKDCGQLPKLVSLKIAAVREAFEEAGVLLCIGKGKKSNDTQKWASWSTLQDLDSWRLRVGKNAKEFLNMCQKNELCPDVNSLHLWSNWLTPPSKNTKRFDTAFFVASLNTTPVAAADNTEIQKLSWFSPSKLMELCCAKELWLPPPQVYEIARLLQFNDIEELNTFAKKRAVQGCERWTPTLKTTSDALLSILPGDDAFETRDEVTPRKQEELNMSSEEYRNQSKVLHRIEFVDKIKPRIVVKNYTSKNGHVLPVINTEL